jgi:4-carboxymuconolactone decarboxylase
MRETKEVPVDEGRFARGETVLNEVTRASGRAVVEGLRDISPELGDFIVEFSYGDVIGRPGLSLRQRELATIAMLGAMGGCEPQLSVHIQGSLNVGCTKTEIVETLLQLCVYAGFPKAINAINCAKKTFAEV